MKATVFSVVALTCSCANAFTFSPTSLRNARPQQTSTRSSMSTASMAREDEFIPSETWFGEYMGEQGLRYALNKTPQEVETEGDYTFWEKLFGQTSNNKKQMELKREVLAKADIPTDPVLYKTWTAKYGYGRFFPVYVDKSGTADDATSSTPSRPNRTAAAPKPKALAAVVSKAVKAQAAPAAKKASSAVKVAPRKPQAAPKGAAKVAVKAEKKVVPKPKPVVKQVVATAKGNIKNIPKAL